MKRYLRSTARLTAVRATAILIASAVLLLCVPPMHAAELFVNHDGSFESGYTYYRCDEPEVGAFAEGFTGPGTVRAVEFYLCVMYWVDTWEVNVYVWDSVDGHPGSVLAMKVTEAHDIHSCGYYGEPNVVELTAPVGREFFVGVRQCAWDWPMLIGADIDGPATGDQSWFNAPFTGWCHTSDAWPDYGVRAMGIGVYLESPPSPAEPSTWGRIKELYHR